MLLSVDQLLEIMPAAGLRTSVFTDPINEAMERWNINTPKRAAAWLAQCAKESQQLTRLSENLTYATPQRLIAVWPVHFCLPVEGEVASLIGKRDARDYVCAPEKLGNFIYGGRGGNGPESSGEGYKYRGRGLIEITFKNEYRACGQALGLDLLSDPGELTSPRWAAQSAGWFWKANGLNELAESGLDDAFERITKKVNGGLTGLAERIAFHDTALSVF